MAGCQTSVVRFVSKQWVTLATMMHGMPQIDQIRLAKTGLCESINTIQGQEDGMRNELLGISRKVRQMDRVTMKNAITTHLKRSRYLRQQLAMLQNKRLALEQHMDTLSTSELNQQVISSVRQTSSALKSMGLNAAQTQADGLLIDMEESILDMQNIQKTLATPLQEDFDVDANALDAEFDLLIADYDEEITAPTVSNYMTVARPLPTARADATHTDATHTDATHTDTTRAPAQAQTPAETPSQADAPRIEVTDM